MKCFFGHKWAGCKCTRCGQVRDEGHDFVLVAKDQCTYKCSGCGEEKTEHSGKGCTCKRCGHVDVNGKHKYEPLGKYVEKCSVCGRLGTDKAYDELVKLFRRGAAGGRLFASRDIKKVREIGEALNEAGRFTLMLRVGERFAENFPLGARHLETSWNGIGTWQG